MRTKTNTPALLSDASYVSVFLPKETFPSCQWHYAYHFLPTRSKFKALSAAAWLFSFAELTFSQWGMRKPASCCVSFAFFVLSAVPDAEQA